MSRRHRLRICHLNAHAIAINRARRLSPADVQMQAAVLRTAQAEFAKGLECEAHWRSLADCANIAETLARMGLGSGPEADRVISTAQTTLADAWQRHQQRGTWTLYADEIDALQWLVQLHITQLEHTSYGEFDTAYQRTHNRMAQALAGNAGRDVVVVGGVGV